MTKAERLAREHAEALLGAERRELRQLVELHRTARTAILDELLAVRADTFTAQHYRTTLVQIEAGLRSMLKKLRRRHESRLDGLLADSIEQTLALVSIHEPKFQGGATGKIQLAAVRQVTRQRALLLNRYATSMSAYGSQLVGDIQRRLGVHLVKRSKGRDMAIDVAGRLDSHAIAGSRWKADRIVRTEMVYASNVGHQAAIESASEVLPGLKRQWDATLDSRTSKVCQFLDGKVVEIHEPWVWRGKEYAHPPAHPACRSVVAPWRAEWAGLASAQGGLE